MRGPYDEHGHWSGAWLLAVWLAGAPVLIVVLMVSGNPRLAADVLLLLVGLVFFTVYLAVVARAARYRPRAPVSYLVVTALMCGTLAAYNAAHAVTGWAVAGATLGALMFVATNARGRVAFWTHVAAAALVPVCRAFQDGLASTSVAAAAVVAVTSIAYAWTWNVRVYFGVVTPS